MRSNAKKVFSRLMTKFESVKREAPIILANEGQKYFNKTFREQQWSNSPWPNVQRRIPGTFAYKYPKTRDLGRHTRPILVGKTRRLKNAVNRSIKGSPNFKRIVWGVYGSVGKYAYYHNSGEGGQKKRTFMGVSSTFKRLLKLKFELVYRKKIR